MNGKIVDMQQEVLSLFVASQQTSASHEKNSILLRKIYQKSAFPEFWQSFLCPIKVILQLEPKETNKHVDRIIQLIGIFLAGLKRSHQSSEIDDSFAEEPLVEKTLIYLFKATQNISDTVRFRSCHLINNILNQLVNFNLSAEMCDAMEQYLLPRLSDSKSAIRLEAIKALHRLQNPEDDNDPLIEKFLELVHGSHAKVRQAVLQRIIIRKDVANVIMYRTLDIDWNVRLTAFNRLSKLLKIFKISDRRLILFRGITDKSEKIRAYIYKDFLTSWLEICDNDIMKLLRSLRIDENEKEIQLTSKLYENVLENFYFKENSVDYLFSKLPLNNKLLPYEEINWESVTYWQILVTFLATNNDLDDVLPEVAFFCDYVEKYLHYSANSEPIFYLEKQYVIQHLFLILRRLEYTESYSSKKVQSLVSLLLKKGDLQDDTIKAIIDSLEPIIPDGETRCHYGMELVSDLLFPMIVEDAAKIQPENELKVVNLRLQLQILRNDQESAIKAENFAEAERLKNEINDVALEIDNLSKVTFIPDEEAKRTNDIPTICNCLDIIFAILRSANFKSFTATLKSLKDDILLDLLSHQNEIVRFKVFRCYAICCIYDKSSARQGVHMFAIPIMAYQAGEECDTEMLILCISAVTDLLRVYGSDLMAEPQDDQLSESVSEDQQKVFIGGTSLTSLIQGIVELMDNEQYEIQLKATEGLCKLILDERIQSASVLSRLILKWCHPDDELKFQSIKQLIGHVLEKLPYLSNSLDQIEGAVLLTINTIVNAPKTSPLAHDVENIAKVLLAMCKISAKGCQLHSNIAISLCSIMNRDPENKLNGLYSKILLMLDLPADSVLLENISTLVEDVREYVYDKSVLKNITKFLSKLWKLKESIIVRPLSSVVAEDISDIEQTDDETSSNF